MSLALLFIGAAAFTTSCGDDEPNSTVVDYYVNVEEEFLVNGSNVIADRFYNPVTRMRDAIKNVYPTPDANGKDEAVVAACDKEYETYCKMYRGNGEHFTCLFHLVRTIKKGTVVKQSETLRTYIYDINPVAEEIEN